MPFQPEQMNEATFKRLVDNLARHSKQHPLGDSPKRSQIQEAVAATLGWSNYHHAITTLRGDGEASKSQGNLGPWIMPESFEVDHCGPSASHKVQLPRFWQRHCQDATARVPVDDFSVLIMLVGQEAWRRKVFKIVQQMNNKKPVLLLTGPASLLSGPAMPGVMVGPTIVRAEDVFSKGSGVDIAKIIVRAMLKSDADSLWVGRAISLVTVVAIVLAHLRDQSVLTLDPDNIESYFELENLVSYAKNETLPGEIKQGLLAYIRSLPGFSQRGVCSTTEEQHGYLTMQIIPAIQAIRTQKTPVFENTLRNLAHISLPDQMHQDDQEELFGSIDAWAKTHPGGWIMLDLLPPSETLWTFVLNRHAHWIDQGVGVWLGTRLPEDIPVQVRDRLVGRAQHTLGK